MTLIQSGDRPSLDSLANFFEFASLFILSFQFPSLSLRRCIHPARLLLAGPETPWHIGGPLHLICSTSSEEWDDAALGGFKLVGSRSGWASELCGGTHILVHSSCAAPGWLPIEIHGMFACTSLRAQQGTLRHTADGVSQASSLRLSLSPSLSVPCYRSATHRNATKFDILI